MQAAYYPGRPPTSTAPRRAPTRLAPAQTEAKARVAVVAKAKTEAQVTRQRSYAQSVIKHLEAITVAQRKRKVGPSALDPALEEPTPMRKNKGKCERKKVKSLLQLSALAVMSHPFGKELATWDKGVAVDCGDE
jgi:hypothetical protein